jgi:hypothetical protein
MWETIKQNPWKTFLGTLTTIVVSVLGFIFTDSRYVHVDKAQADKIEIQQQIDKIKQELTK